MKHRDRIGEVELKTVSRFAPTPEPYMLHIREEFDDNGVFVRVIHRKRVYWSGVIVDEILT